MHRHTRSRRRGGQALVEAALALPVLLTLALGTFDLGHIVADRTVVTAEANAGATQAVTSQTSDVGTAIRNASTTLASATQWGNGNSGSADDCATASPAHPCGDTGQCASGSAWWNTAGTVGCFSLGHCTLVTGATSTCTPAAWGDLQSARPTAGGTTQLVVRVVIRFTPVTPFVKNLQPTGKLYVSDTLVSQQTY